MPASFNRKPIQPNMAKAKMYKPFPVRKVNYTWQERTQFDTMVQEVRNRKVPSQNPQNATRQDSLYDQLHNASVNYPNQGQSN
jgi:hypothetical protein